MEYWCLLIWSSCSVLSCACLICLPIFLCSIVVIVVPASSWSAMILLYWACLWPFLKNKVSEFPVSWSATICGSDSALFVCVLMMLVFQNQQTSASLLSKKLCSLCSAVRMQTSIHVHHLSYGSIELKYFIYHPVFHTDRIGNDRDCECVRNGDFIFTGELRFPYIPEFVL